MSVVAPPITAREAESEAAGLLTRLHEWVVTVDHKRLGVMYVVAGLVFFLIAITLGSIWARPIWNTWWTWDPRLTTATITELIYIAYFMVRGAIENPDLRARISAVYTLVGSASVPLTFFSIRLLRTIHPVVIAGNNDAQSTFAMTPHMLTAASTPCSAVASNSPVSGFQNSSSEFDGARRTMRSTRCSAARSA